MITALVMARRGSVRCPGKNLAKVGGRTLVQRAVTVAADHVSDGTVGAAVLLTDYKPGEACLESRLFAHMPEPADLASGELPVETVLGYVADELEMRDDDHLLLLNPTSPFRRFKTACRVIDAALATGPCYQGAVTSRPAREVLEHHVVGKRWEHLSCIALHGAAIMVPVEQLRANPPRLLGPGCALVETDELEAIDIDTPFDLEVAQMLAERHGL